MQIGMIGLGRMGANMAHRLMNGGHTCAVLDLDAARVKEMEGFGAKGAADVDGLVRLLDAPRAVWIMVPSGAPTEEMVTALIEKLSPGDTIIDGGNSYYKDDVRRAATAEQKGIHYIDAGTSGGVWGLERGYCLMVGGKQEAVERLYPVLKTLSPGVAEARLTPGRKGETTAEHGYLYCGPPGAGHFVKMVHNGIEYGLMAAYAEGLNVLANANIGSESRPEDAETAPLTHPEYYRYDLDLASIAEVWRRGSVVASWLLDLTATALYADPQLDNFAGRVSDSGEGRWTVHAAVDEGVPVPVLATALMDRFASRGRADMTNRILSAMRAQFGGHAEKPADEAAAH